MPEKLKISLTGHRPADLYMSRDAFKKFTGLDKNLKDYQIDPNMFYQDPDTKATYTWGNVVDRANNAYNYNNPEWSAFRQDLENKLEQIIAQGNTIEAHSGMALGADTAWAMAILNVKSRHPNQVEFVANIPDENQGSNWPVSSRNFYNQLLSQADRIENTYEMHPEAESMSIPQRLEQRNKDMIGNSQIVFSLWNHMDGGTANGSLDAYNMNGVNSLVRLNPANYGFDIPKVGQLKNTRRNTFYSNRVFKAMRQEELERQKPGYQPQQVSVQYSRNGAAAVAEPETPSSQKSNGLSIQDFRSRLAPYMGKKQLNNFIKQYQDLLSNADNDSKKGSGLLPEYDNYQDRTIEIFKALNDAGLSYSLRPTNDKYGRIQVTVNNGESGWLTVYQVVDGFTPKTNAGETVVESKHPEYSFGAYAGPVFSYTDQEGRNNGHEALIADLLTMEGKNPNQFPPSPAEDPNAREHAMYDALDDKHKRLLVIAPLAYASGRKLSDFGIDDVELRNNMSASVNRNHYQSFELYQKGTNVRLGNLFKGGEKANNYPIRQRIASRNVYREVLGPNAGEPIKMADGHRWPVESTKERLSYNRVEIASGQVERDLANKFRDAREAYVNTMFYDTGASVQFDEIKEKFDAKFDGLSRFNTMDAVYKAMKDYATSLDESRLLFQKSEDQGNPNTPEYGRKLDFMGIQRVNEKGETLDFSAAADDAKGHAIKVLGDALRESYQNEDNDYDEESFQNYSLLVARNVMGALNDMDNYLGDGFNTYNVLNMARLTTTSDYLAEEKQLTDAFSLSSMADMVVATEDFNKTKLASRMLQFDQQSAITDTSIDWILQHDSKRTLKNIDANGYGMINGEVYDFKTPAYTGKLTKVDPSLYDPNSARSIDSLKEMFDSVKEELAQQNVSPQIYRNNQGQNVQAPMVFLDKNGIVRWSGTRSMVKGSNLTDANGSMNFKEVRANVYGDVGQVFLQDDKGLIHVEEAGHGKGETTFVAGLMAHIDNNSNPNASLAQSVVVKQYGDYLADHLRQTIRRQLVRSNTAGDLSIAEETYDLYKLYHGESDILTKLEPEDLIVSENHPQEVIDALIEQYRVQVKLPDGLRDSMSATGLYNDHNEIIENTHDWIKFRAEHLIVENKRKGNVTGPYTSEQLIEFQKQAINEFKELSYEEKMSLVGTYMSNHGGITVRDISHEDNKGYFSQNVTHNGGSLGIYRYLESLDQIDESGHIKPLVDENGERREVVTPLEKAYPEIKHDLYANPTDRKTIVTHMLLEAHGVNKGTKVMLANLGGLTDEDAGIISKEYAEKAGIPLDMEKERRDAKMVALTEKGNSNVRNLIGKDFYASSRSGKALHYRLTVINDSGLPLAPEDVTSDTTINQDNLALVRVKKDGSYFKLTARGSVYSVKTGENRFAMMDENGNATKVTFGSIARGGRIITDESQRPTTRPLRVGDKISDGSGNKMTIADVIDPDYVNDNPKNFEERQKARLSAIFKQTGAEVVANPYTILSRKNAGQVLRLEETYQGDGSTIKVTDPVTGKDMDLNAQIAEMEFITTNKTAEAGTSFKGRAYSQQMAWADLERGATGIVEEMYGNNYRDLMELKETYRVAGYAFDDNNELGFVDRVVSDDEVTDLRSLLNKGLGINDENGPLKRLLDVSTYGISYDSTVGKYMATKADVKENLLANYKSTEARLIKEDKVIDLLEPDLRFKEEFSNRGGSLKLPVKIELASGAKTDILPIVPPEMRKSHKNENGTVVASEFTSAYDKILKESTAYAFYAYEKEQIEQGNIPFVAADIKVRDKKGKATGQYRHVTAEEQKQQYLNNLNDELSKAEANIQRNALRLSNSVQAKHLGNDDTAAKHGDLRDKILSNKVKDGVTAVMANGSSSCKIDEILVSKKIAKNFKSMEADENGYLHVKGHPDWDMMHVDRQPVWHSTGTLGFKVRVVDGIDGVKMNPAFVGALDGDFDGDNLGILPINSEKGQRDLHTKLSVATNLVNIGTNKNDPDLNLSTGGAWLAGAINSGKIDSLDDKYRLDENGEFKGPKAALNAFYKDKVLNGGTVTIDGSEVELVGYKDRDKYSEEEFAESAMNTMKWLNQEQEECLENAFEHSGVRFDTIDHLAEDLAWASEKGLKGKTKDLSEALGYMTGVEFEAVDPKKKQEVLAQRASENGTTVEEEQNRIYKKFAQSGYTPEQISNMEAKSGVMSLGNDFDYQSKYSEVNIANAAKSENTGMPGKNEQKLVAALRSGMGLEVALEIAYPQMQGNLQVKHSAEDAVKMIQMFNSQMKLLLNGKADNPRLAFDKVDLNNSKKRYQEELDFAADTFFEGTEDYYKKCLNFNDKSSTAKKFRKNLGLDKEEQTTSFETNYVGNAKSHDTIDNEKYPKFYDDKFDKNDALTADIFVKRYKRLLDEVGVDVDEEGLKVLATYLSDEDPKTTTKSLKEMIIRPIDELVEQKSAPMDYVALKGASAAKNLAIQHGQKQALQGGKPFAPKDYMSKKEFDNYEKKMNNRKNPDIKVPPVPERSKYNLTFNQLINPKTKLEIATAKEDVASYLESDGALKDVSVEEKKAIMDGSYKSPYDNLAQDVATNVIILELSKDDSHEKIFTDKKLNEYIAQTLDTDENQTNQNSKELETMLNDVDLKKAIATQFVKSAKESNFDKQLETKERNSNPYFGSKAKLSEYLAQIEEKQEAAPEVRELSKAPAPSATQTVKDFVQRKVQAFNNSVQSGKEVVSQQISKNKEAVRLYFEGVQRQMQTQPQVAGLQYATASGNVNGFGNGSVPFNNQNDVNSVGIDNNEADDGLSDLIDNV
ncbi:SLOG family protein [Ligilactobacillus equi]|nr:SLOG family protein [Ligilactobacillus equi]